MGAGEDQVDGNAASMLPKFILTEVKCILCMEKMASVYLRSCIRLMGCSWKGFNSPTENIPVQSISGNSQDSQSCLGPYIPLLTPSTKRAETLCFSSQQDDIFALFPPKNRFPTQICGCRWIFVSLL